MRRSIVCLLAILLPLLCGCSLIRRSPSTSPPSAVIAAAPSEGNAPLVVRFDGFNSVDDEGIVAFAWDFGDGSAAASGGATAHTYDRPGVYTARLTAIDASGLSDACEAEIVVANSAPIASIRLSNDAPVIGERVQFDASGSLDPDGSLIDFVWDFGDGDSLRGTRVSHVYDELGVVTVALTVEDEFGALATMTHAITVHRGSAGGGCGGGSPIAL